MRAALFPHQNHRLQTSVVLAIVAVFSLTTLAACGSDPEKKEPTDTSGGGQDAAVTDVGQDAGPQDVGQKLSLKWTEMLPDTAGKMRAVAAVPGQPGSYIVVGEKATVLRIDGDKVTDISPTSIGKPALNAVWVDKDGSVIVGGSGSTLITYDGTSWQVAGAVPPTPPVTFLAIHGVQEGAVWAVGEEGAAFKREGAVWGAAAVTATGGEGIGADADFVDVRVSAKGAVWIAANKGAKAAGVVLQSDDGKTWTGTATESAPRALWVDPSDGKQAGGALIVGGTTSAFVHAWDGKGFADAGDVKWQLGFRCAEGMSAKEVWIGGLKGQLRAWDGAAWSVVKVAPPVGTVGGFPTPSADVLSLAVHASNELMFLTSFKLYRFGEQP